RHDVACFPLPCFIRLSDYDPSKDPSKHSAKDIQVDDERAADLEPKIVRIRVVDPPRAAYQAPPSHPPQPATSDPYAATAQLPARPSVSNYLSNSKSRRVDGHTYGADPEGCHRYESDEPESVVLWLGDIYTYADTRVD
nr:hypothetical protein [Tanacetum cinerariifolium]